MNKRQKTREKELSTKGHEERRRGTKALVEGPRGMGRRSARGSTKDTRDKEDLSAKKQQGPRRSQWEGIRPHRDLKRSLTSMHRIHRILQETAGFSCRESANPHRIIARVGFWCRKLSSCLSCASMFNLSSFSINLPHGGPWLCPMPRFPVSVSCSGLWSY